MRSWTKRLIAAAVMVGALATGTAAHAALPPLLYGQPKTDSTPSKLCFRLGVYIYPVDEIIQCIPMP